MTPDPTATIALAGAAVAVVLGVVALIVAVRALRRSRRAERRYRAIVGSDRDVVDVLLDRVSAIDVNAKAIEQLAKVVADTRDEIAHSIRHLAVIRYDAFRDMGGRRSFSAALLDDTGDGLVLTNLCGRTESQTIAKGVTAGTGTGLSPEEQDAVKFAMKGERA